MSSQMVLPSPLSVSMSLLNCRSGLESVANVLCYLHATCCKIRYKRFFSCSSFYVLLVKNGESSRVEGRASHLLCIPSVPGLGLLVQPIHTILNSMLFLHLNYSAPKMMVAFALIFDGIRWK